MDKTAINENLKKIEDENFKLNKKIFFIVHIGLISLCIIIFIIQLFNTNVSVSTHTTTTDSDSQTENDGNSNHSAGTTTTKIVTVNGVTKNYINGIEVQ